VLNEKGAERPLFVFSPSPACGRGAGVRVLIGPLDIANVMFGGLSLIHVHCRKADMECKYWIDESDFDIHKAYSYGMYSRDKKEIRKIIFGHFDYIVDQWKEFQERR
jgi:hypothetical protein